MRVARRDNGETGEGSRQKKELTSRRAPCDCSGTFTYPALLGLKL